MMVMKMAHNYQVLRNKASKDSNLFNGKNFNKDSDNLAKSKKLMEGIGIWGSWYKRFPHLFVRDYLGVTLKPFQKILIYYMAHYNYFMYIASRGQGKSFLTAIFCCVRCILYPETKVIISAGKKGQAKEIIEKIDDLKNKSPNLSREINYINTGSNDPKCEFHNGSWIKIVASNDNARSKRANLLIADEFRMINLEVVNKVLRKFLTAPRQPKYLEKPEYAHLLERNKEIYLSSAWFCHHWSWEKVQAFFKAMVKGKEYFLCSLPYQLAIKEGLLDRQQVKDEMSESDFDELS